MIKRRSFNSIFLILILVNAAYLPLQSVMAGEQKSCNKNSQSICDNFTGMELIKVPSGCFLMGSIDGNWNEQPVHQVQLEEFYLGKYEVTQGQWQKVMGDNPAKFTVGDNYPVIGVGWDDVQTFIRKLNSITGRTYRLPTEAEWEYACRSGGKDEKYCGGDDPSKIAWYGEERSEENNFHLVGQKLSNGLGLHDMSGNVIEWVQDRYGHSYYQNSPINNPMGDSENKQRVLRGGHWSYSAKRSRSTVRNWFLQKWSGGVEIGFRLALTQESSAIKKNINISTTPCPDNFQSIQNHEINLQFVTIPAGCFQMGSVNGEDDEQPVHKVCITNSFELSKYEVTQKQWETVMGYNPSGFRTGDNHPVERVSWPKVQEFIRRLNAKTDQNYRLPTEAEWEYACRSGGENQKYCGGDNASIYAWYGEDRKRGHHVVGSKLPNNLGLYDMTGNVWEWVQDKYDDNYYQYSPVNDPTGPPTGSMRIFRGGSWFNNLSLRSSNRYPFLPQISLDFLGFRLVRSLPENKIK